MKPKIAKLTGEQKARADEKAAEMYEWITRILIGACHSDSEAAADTDPDIFTDGFALLSYITSGAA